MLNFASLKMNQEKTEQSIEKLQMLEQSLQNNISQRVVFQENKAEIENAISELNGSEECYKIVGNLIVKSNKQKQIEELDKQLKIVNSRISALQKNEDLLKEKINNLRQDTADKI
jgi:prefoldin beta subunit